MNKTKITILKSLLLLSVIASPYRISYAALDDFSPYAYTRVLYDSNVFRLSDDVDADEVLIGGSKDDTITHLGLGLTSDLKLSRQHLLFDLNLDRAVYNKNDELDHTAVNGRAVWSWLAGSQLSGNLGYRYKRELSSFTESDVRVKDMRTRGMVYLDAGYEFHPDWRLEGGVSYSDVTYQQRTNLDREISTTQFEVQYKNTLNTKVGVRFLHSSYDLKADIDDYEEDEISGVLYWEGSGKSALEARLGYIDLSYKNAEDRDFNGMSANLIYHWMLTGKTKLNISAWRETSSKDSEISTYVISQGVSIRPIWSATRIISLEGEAKYENEDFKGDNPTDGEQRSDDTLLLRVSANWDPRRNIRVSLGYRMEHRDSNFNLRDFDDNQVSLSARVNF